MVYMNPDHVPYLLCKERPLEQSQFDSQHVKEGVLHASPGSWGIFRAFQEWEGRLAGWQTCSSCAAHTELPAGPAFPPGVRSPLSGCSGPDLAVLPQNLIWFWGEIFISSILVKHITCTKPHCVLLWENWCLTFNMETACDDTPSQVYALSSSAPSQPCSD